MRFLKIFLAFTIVISCFVFPVSADDSASVAAEGNCTVCGGVYSNGFCLTDNSHHQVPSTGADGYYEIYNAGNLYWFCEQVNGGNNTINCRLMADISDNTPIYDANGTLGTANFRVWTPIGKKATFSSTPFNGVFDGNGRILTNFYNANGDDHTSIIGYLGSSGTVKNLGIALSYFKGADYVGGLVGLNEGTITNCFNRAEIIADWYGGGITGQNDGSVSNCYSLGTIKGSKSSTSYFSGSRYIGSIVGKNNKTLSNTYYLTGTASVGTLVHNGVGGTTSAVSDTAGNTTAVTMEQVLSGEVTYLLQSGNTTQVWGQHSTSTLPHISTSGVYAVAKYDNGSGYSITSLGDLDDNKTINIDDYQLFVNYAVSGDNHIDSTDVDPVIFNRADVNGDYVIDVLDVAQVLRMYKGQCTVPIYGPGDFDGDGICTDTDTQKIKQAITNRLFVGKSSLMACDMNCDGVYDGADIKYAFGYDSVDNYVFFDTQYGEHERNYLDLYIPKGKKAVGVVLMIHGGAWTAGDKNVYRYELEQFAQMGFATAAVNYRYVDDNVDAMDVMDDIEAAVAKIKELGESCGVELTGLLTTGGSAGAHLALLYAYARAESSAIPPKAVVSFCGPTDVADEYYYYNEELQCNNGVGDEEFVAQILGWLAGYPHTYATRADAKEALAAVSPINYVNESCVPTVINHGMVDDIVPYRNATNLAAKLEECGVTYVLNPYPNSGHGLDVDTDCIAYANQLYAEYAVKYLDSIDA